jgi:hypothetical protein
MRAAKAASRSTAKAAAKAAATATAAARSTSGSGHNNILLEQDFYAYILPRFVLSVKSFVQKTP